MRHARCLSLSLVLILLATTLPASGQSLEDTVAGLDPVEQLGGGSWQVLPVEVTRADLAVAWRLMQEPSRTELIDSVTDAATLMVLRPAEDRLWAVTVTDSNRPDLTVDFVPLAEAMTRASMEELNTLPEGGPRFEDASFGGYEDVQADAAGRVDATLLVPGSVPAPTTILRVVRGPRIVELLMINIDTHAEQTAAWIEAAFALPVTDPPQDG